jgi:hypothetical protein
LINRNKIQIEYCLTEDMIVDYMTKPDRNYTAMRTHVQRSVHLSALLITWVTLRRWIATKIRLWHCLLHRSSPSHSW